MNFIDKVDNILSLFSDFWVKRDDEIKKKILSVIESIEKESIKECIENIGLFQCKYDDNIPVDFDHMGSVFALESYFKVYSLVKFDKLALLLSNTFLIPSFSKSCFKFNS